jgi:adenylyl-sulfate kinase
MPSTSCPIFWLFGLSGAGKSTMANALIGELRSRGHAVLALDGDDLRAGLCRGLGFSDLDRAENLRRAAEVARLGSASGLCVVASFITPLESHRQLVAGILHRQKLSLIHVDASLAVCRERDTKGLYAQAKSNQMDHITGLSSPFETSPSAALVIHTDKESPAASSVKLLNFVLGRLQAASVPDHA